MKKRPMALTVAELPETGQESSGTFSTLRPPTPGWVGDVLYVDVALKYGGDEG